MVEASSRGCPSRGPLDLQPGRGEGRQEGVQPSQARCRGAARGRLARLSRLAQDRQDVAEFIEHGRGRAPHGGQGIGRCLRLDGEQVLGHAGLDADHGHVVRDYVVQLASDAHPLLGHAAAGLVLAAALGASGALLHRGQVRASAAQPVGDRGDHQGPGQDGQGLLQEQVARRPRAPASTRTDAVDAQASTVARRSPRRTTVYSASSGASAASVSRPRVRSRAAAPAVVSASASAGSRLRSGTAARVRAISTASAPDGVASPVSQGATTRSPSSRAIAAATSTVIGRRRHHDCFGPPVLVTAPG